MRINSAISHAADPAWPERREEVVAVQCSPEGKVLRPLGAPGEAGCDGRHFDQPAEVVVTPEGDVFVSDGYGNARVNWAHGLSEDSKRNWYLTDVKGKRGQKFAREAVNQG